MLKDKVIYMDNSKIDKLISLDDIFDSIEEIKILTDKENTNSFNKEMITYNIIFKHNMQELCYDYFFLGAFNILLYKYTSQNNFIISILDEMELIPIIIHIKDNSISFSQYLRELKGLLNTTKDEMDSRISKLVDLGYLSYEALSKIIITFDNKINKYKLRKNNLLYFNFKHSTKGIEIDVTYNAQLLSRLTVETMLERYKKILEQVNINIHMKLSDISILLKDEKDIILYKFNQVDTSINKKYTILHIFRDVVEKYPERTAVNYNDESITYKELDNKSNQIANYLKNKEVSYNDVIGIIIKRSIDMIAAIWGILKANGTYLPIDKDLPEDRITYIIKDSKCKYVLTDDDNLTFSKMISLNNKSIESSTNSNLPIDSLPEHNAYIIYTSGTTGKPKGVIIQHKAIVNLKYIMDDILEINETDNVLSFASISFDASVLEIFSALLNGSSLTIVPKPIILNYFKFQQFICHKGITFALLPPPYLQLLDINKISSVKKIATGGSEVSISIANELMKRVSYFNLYGPTEATVFCTYWKAKRFKGHSIPIGKPVLNSKIMILDKNNNIQPIGIAGELCISGELLAKGYLNRPKLQKEKFIQIHVYDNNREIYYKTGDLARWLPDGNIEFLGRLDNQVKIKGYRIELSEIEYHIRNFELIKDVKAILTKGSSPSISAFVVLKDSNNKCNLKEYLNNKLPYYMIPSDIIYLDNLPLTNNGKIDIKKLQIMIS